MLRDPPGEVYSCECDRLGERGVELDHDLVTQQSRMLRALGRRQQTGVSDEAGLRLP